MWAGSWAHGAPSCARRQCIRSSCCRQHTAPHCRPGTPGLAWHRQALRPAHVPADDGQYTITPPPPLHVLSTRTQRDKCVPAHVVRRVLRRLPVPVLQAARVRGGRQTCGTQRHDVGVRVPWLGAGAALPARNMTGTPRVARHDSACWPGARSHCLWGAAPTHLAAPPSPTAWHMLAATGAPPACPPAPGHGVCAEEREFGASRRGPVPMAAPCHDCAQSVHPTCGPPTPCQRTRPAHLDGRQVQGRGPCIAADATQSIAAAGYLHTSMVAAG